MSRIDRGTSLGGFRNLMSHTGFCIIFQTPAYSLSVNKVCLALSHPSLTSLYTIKFWIIERPCRTQVTRLPDGTVAGLLTLDVPAPITTCLSHTNDLIRCGSTGPTTVTTHLSSELLHKERPSSVQDKKTGLRSGVSSKQGLAQLLLYSPLLLLLPPTWMRLELGLSQSQGARKL